MVSGGTWKDGVLSSSRGHPAVQAAVDTQTVKGIFSLDKELEEIFSSVEASEGDENFAIEGVSNDVNVQHTSSMLLSSNVIVLGSLVLKATM